MNTPLIDLRKWRRGSAAERRALARRVDRACRRRGFLAIAGHGVPVSVTRAARAAARAFFALPEAEKRRSARPGVSRGWVGLGAEALAYSAGRRTPPDLNESFQVGPEGRGAPNAWPRRPRALKPAWGRYYKEMERLSAELQGLFAAALGLPEGWFDDKIDRHASRLRARLYPAGAGAPLPGQLRAGAHTDYVSLAIVSADGRGLQFRRGSRWIDAPRADGALLVNLGDLTARWTNGRWFSPPHRVANPARGARPEDRLSLIYFHAPNDDALIEALPGCGRAKHPPVRAGEYVRAKLARARTKRP